MPNWNSVTKVLNEILETNYETPKMFQKRYKELRELILKEASDMNTNIKLNLKSEQDLFKERVRNNDVKREYRKSLRDEARIENLLDNLYDSIEKLEPLEFKPFTDTVSEHNNKAVVCIADVHLGDCFENYVNKYNVEIAAQRLDEYADTVIDTINQSKVDEVLILNLGDFINGSIHVSTRVESEIDAIEQTALASELLSKFLLKINNNTNCKIKYGSVLDNHSRINVDKKSHIEKESFAKLIDIIVKLRLKDSDIEFVGNPIDDNIGYIEFANRKISWVHGHTIKKNKAKADISNIVGNLVDVVYTAHMHNLFINDNVIQVGSMVGVNSYAFNLGKSEPPNQLITIYEPNGNVIYKQVIFKGKPNKESSEV